MIVVTSSIFHILQFPHQGKTVAIDQLYYFSLDLHNSLVNNVPFLGQYNLQYKSVGVGLLKYSSLMGVFLLPPLDPPHVVSTLNMIRVMVKRSSESFDSWIVHNPSSTKTLSDTMSLSLANSRLPHDLVHKSSLPMPILVDPLSSSLSGETIPHSNQKSTRV